MASSRPFYNQKISTEFYDTLINHPYFQANPKGILPSFYLLNRISSLSDMNDGNAVEFYAPTINSIFHPYKVKYAECLAVLETLNILHVNHNYQVAVENVSPGHCKQYLVKDLGHSLLAFSNLQYWKALHEDQKIKRQNRKGISRRGVFTKSYPDPVQGNMYDILCNANYDYKKADAYISSSCWTDSTKNQVANSLIAFQTKDFNEIKASEKDGRYHTEWVLTKSDVRALFDYKGMPYKAIIDIRACHPTFFSVYLMDFFYNVLPFTSLPSPLHYVSLNGDKKDVYSNICEITLKAESRKWVELFTNPTVDPREIIGKDCDYKKETVKEALNKTINGSTEFQVIIKWMKTHFPTLMKVWEKTDKKRTGNLIAKCYETPLINHVALLNHVESLGLKMMPEHDGGGIFANSDETDSTLTSKMDFIIRYLSSYAMKTWGVPIVMKSELVKDYTNADAMLLMQGKWEQFNKEKKVLDEQEERSRSAFFGSRSPQAWERSQTARDKSNDLFIRYREVIEYFAGTQKIK